MGRTSNVLTAVADPASLHARLRCASLSQFDGSFPGGMTTGSNAISAIRHWCRLRRIDCWIGSGGLDGSKNGPSTFVEGTRTGRRLLGVTWSGLNGWLMSSQHPKNVSTSEPFEWAVIVRTFGSSVCWPIELAVESTRASAKHGIVTYSVPWMPGEGNGLSVGVARCPSVLVTRREVERAARRLGLEQAEEHADVVGADQADVVHLRQREVEDGDAVLVVGLQVELRLVLERRERVELRGSDGRHELLDEPRRVRGTGDPGDPELALVGPHHEDAEVDAEPERVAVQEERVGLLDELEVRVRGGRAGGGVHGHELRVGREAERRVASPRSRCRRRT